MKIERLIDIVTRGGSVRTGIDIHCREGVLPLEKNFWVNSVSTLLIIKQMRT
jgi:hypothetical protein